VGFLKGISDDMAELCLFLKKRTVGKLDSWKGKNKRIVGKANRWTVGKLEGKKIGE